MDNKMIQIKVDCRACGGKAYLRTGESFLIDGNVHHRVTPCTACKSTGKEIQWVDLQDFANMLMAIAAEKQPANG